eukprot:12880793-Prorocentrum_lima.AAC.1
MGCLVSQPGAWLPTVVQGEVLEVVLVVCLGCLTVLRVTFPVMMIEQSPPASCALPSWLTQCRV